MVTLRGGQDFFDLGAYLPYPSDEDRRARQHDSDEIPYGDGYRMVKVQQLRHISNPAVFAKPESDRAFVGHGPENTTNQGGLAGTIGADQRMDRTRLDLNIDVLQDPIST